VLSPVLACKTLLPQMIQRRHGIIICLTSSVVTNESPNLPGTGAVNVVYSATKAALHRFAQGLVKEVREYNIPVILIDPGFALTGPAPQLAPHCSANCQPSPVRLNS
jgi:short-subunit dehydrogenase